MIKLREVFVGMVVEDIDKVEDDPYHSRMWKLLPEGGWELVQMAKKSPGYVDWAPTVDPKGVTTEKDEWEWSAAEQKYLRQKGKEEVKRGMVGGVSGSLLLVAAAILALWYFLLGRQRG